MSRSIDLSHRHWLIVRGDITVIATWLHQGIDSHRPCIVLIRTGDERSEHCAPYVITVDNAYVWDLSPASIPLAHYQTIKIAQQLRLSEDKRTFMRIAMLVHDLLDHLLIIPPYQPRDSEVVAEVTMTNRATGKTKEVEIRDDV